MVIRPVAMRSPFIIQAQVEVDVYDHITRHVFVKKALQQQMVKATLLIALSSYVMSDSSISTCFLFRIRN